MTVENSDILVSVWCTAYNHEKYIRECLKGFIKQQTTFKFEVIVHDDASSDSTASIIKEYEQKHPMIIKPIYQQVNQYSQKHINMFQTFFLPRAKGKYIAFCEGDDYWTDPLKLQKQVGFLEANPDYGFIHTDYSVCNSGKNTILKKKYIWPSGDILNLLLLGVYNIGTLTVLFRKDIYDSIPKFYTNQKFKMGDLPLWIELARVTRVKYLPDNTATYRFMDNSASHSNDIEKEIAFALSSYEVKRFYSTQFGIMRDNQKDDFDLNCRIVKLAYLKHNPVVSKKYYSELKNTPYKIPWKIKLFYWGTRFRIVSILIKLLYKLPTR